MFFNFIENLSKYIDIFIVVNLQTTWRLLKAQTSWLLKSILSTYKQREISNCNTMCVTTLCPTERFFAPRTKPRCCFFMRKKKKLRYGVGDGSSDWIIMHQSPPNCICLSLPFCASLDSTNFQSLIIFWWKTLWWIVSETSSTDLKLFAPAT